VVATFLHFSSGLDGLCDIDLFLMSREHEGKSRAAGVWGTLLGSLAQFEITTKGLRQAVTKLVRQQIVKHA
jgi:hypothetical protein